MAALVGALVVAAGFLLLAIVYFLFRRPNPHPLTLQDDFGGYVAVTLTAILALGVSTFVEHWGAARAWQLGVGLAAIALSVALLAVAAQRARALSRAGPAAISGKGPDPSSSRRR